ncbi:MAG TPA: hypothetical protein VF266_03550 [Thermoanaerobaculia bacterium]
MQARTWLLCAVLAAFAVPAFAQYNERQLLREVDETDSGGGWYDTTSYRQGQYLDNPCTSSYDAVWVDYSAYLEGQQKTAGFDRYIFDESTTVSGLYSASGSAQADVTYASPVAIRNYYKLNTSDNFHVVTVINFDPASQYTSLTVETACGDGSPDSKE